MLSWGELIQKKEVDSHYCLMYGMLASLLENFELTPAELQILSRGRNASTSKSNNRKNPKAYQDSTAIEALIGYLYITDKARLEVLFNWISVFLERV